jgi:hypothetical protein
LNPDGLIWAEREKRWAAAGLEKGGRRPGRNHFSG